jgi:hypothetical protein
MDEMSHNSEFAKTDIWRKLLSTTTHLYQALDEMPSEEQYIDMRKAGIQPGQWNSGEEAKARNIFRFYSGQATRCGEVLETSWKPLTGDTTAPPGSEADLTATKRAVAAVNIMANTRDLADSLGEFATSIDACRPKEDA